jgi:hypothetical protein
MGCLKLVGVEQHHPPPDCREVVLQLEIVEDRILGDNIFEEGSQVGNIPLAVAQLVNQSVLGFFGRDLKSLVKGAVGEKADKKARLRTLKDLDGAAATLADVCRVLLDPALPDDRVRNRVFEKIPQPLLEHAVENVDALIRPPEDVFYKELDARYAAVRRYLPAVLNHVRFEASPAGKPVVQAYDWLRDNSHGTKPAKNPPQEVITNAWQRYVFRKDSSVDIHAYTFCMLDQLVTALHRRDVFTKPSWRYADPRANGRSSPRATVSGIANEYRPNMLMWSWRTTAAVKAPLQSQHVLSVDAAKQLTLDHAFESDPRIAKVGDLVSTKQVIEEELAMLCLARDGKDKHSPLGAGKDWTFQDAQVATDEGQRNAVIHLLTSRDLALSIRGKAGSGKSTMAREAVAAIESCSGRKVFLFAPSSGAVEVLRKDGLPGETFQLLNANGQMQKAVAGHG